jgi:hypothetical protein
MNSLRATTARLTLASVLCMIMLLSGCVTRYANFRSTPSGAMVTVCGQTGTTPCQLRVPHAACTAELKLPSGEQKTVDIPEGVSLPARMTAGVLSTAAGALEIGSAPFYLAGGCCLLLLGLTADDDPYPYYPLHSDDDSEVELKLLVVGVGSLCVGAVLHVAGDCLSEIAEEIAGRPEDRIDVHFYDVQAPESSPVSAPAKTDILRTLEFLGTNVNDRTTLSNQTHGTTVPMRDSLQKHAKIEDRGWMIEDGLRDNGTTGLRNQD